VKERAVTFGSTGGLVGVLAEPEGATAAAAPTVLLFNIGLNHRVGPGRLNVDLARALAAAGYRSLRFDLSGLGDSEARADGSSDAERAILDLREAMDFLQKRCGSATFVPVGLCSGTDGAHGVALADERVRGAVFIDGYAYPTFGYGLRHALEKARYATSGFRWSRMVKRRLRRVLGLAHDEDRETGAPMTIFERTYPPRSDFRAALDALVARGVSLLFVYTADAWFFNHASQFAPMVGWSELPPGVIVERWAEADHSFSTVAPRRRLVARLVAWMEEAFPAPRTDTARERSAS
jgi:pimeloyl-ACP methyl ester carboxylesterase